MCVKSLEQWLVIVTSSISTISYNYKYIRRSEIDALRKRNKVLKSKHVSLPKIYVIIHIFNERCDLLVKQSITKDDESIPIHVLARRADVQISSCEKISLTGIIECDRGRNKHVKPDQSQTKARSKEHYLMSSPYIYPL